MKGLEIEYPNFSNWYHQKVYQGLENGTRSLLIARDNASKKIAGISIIKNYHEKKICTFRILSEFQHKGIGSKLMEKSLEILETDSPLITVSEDHINEFQNILNKFNFKEIKKYDNYYKEGKFEISYNGYLEKKCLFSIKPEFAFKILEGKKTFEYRKNRTKENVSCMVIYATAPVKKIIGDVKIINIINDTPENIWQLTHKTSGISYEMYFKYFLKKRKAYAYHLEYPNKYSPYKELKDFEVKQAPQSYQYL